MDYALHLAIITCIYIILSVSLDLIAGYTGILSLAHAAFYGIGAYTTALVAVHLRLPFVWCLAVSLVAAMALGGIVSAPALRIRGDYLVIATFGFQVIFYHALSNWTDFTGGPMGVFGIPQPTVLGYTVTSRSGFLLLTVWLTGICVWACRRLAKAPFGRVLQGIREDEIFTLALGKSISTYKVKVTVIGAVMAAVAGALYASYISFIDPTSFSIMESILILAIVIIGGAGTIWGPALGACLLVTVPELLRFIGIPAAIAPNLRQILYGGLLMGFAIWRPQGLLGRYAFR